MHALLRGYVYDYLILGRLQGMPRSIIQRFAWDYSVFKLPCGARVVYWGYELLKQLPCWILSPDNC